MQGSTKRATVTDGLPEGWMLHHYADRQQPWTLLRTLGYSLKPTHRARGIYRNWEVVRFSRTLDEAVRRAEKG